MAFTVPDQDVYAVSFLLAIYFSTLASVFSFREMGQFKVVAGEIWGHLRAMIFPFFAAISWYMFAAFNVAAGNGGTNLLFYFSYMMLFVYVVVGIVMVFYLALHPIEKVLDGEGP